MFLYILHFVTNFTLINIFLASSNSHWCSLSFPMTKSLFSQNSQYFWLLSSFFMHCSYMTLTLISSVCAWAKWLFNLLKTQNSFLHIPHWKTKFSFNNSSSWRDLGGASEHLMFMHVPSFKRIWMTSGELLKPIKLSWQTFSRFDSSSWMF